jgi:hypothetical protein
VESTAQRRPRGLGGPQKLISPLRLPSVNETPNPKTSRFAANPDGSAAVVVFNMGTVAADYEVTIGTQAIDANIPGQALQTILLKP